MLSAADGLQDAVVCCDDGQLENSSAERPKLTYAAALKSPTVSPAHAQEPVTSSGLFCSEQPHFFPIKPAEFPHFQLPQYGLAVHVLSADDEFQLCSQQDALDRYVFSDCNNLLRPCMQGQQLTAALRLFKKQLSAKFRFERIVNYLIPVSRKKWKQRPTTSLEGYPMQADRTPAPVCYVQPPRLVCYVQPPVLVV